MVSTKQLSVGAGILAAFLCISTSVQAQSDRATLTGVVTDQTGAVVPNATITVTDTNTGEVHTSQSDAAGDYTVQELKADPYAITFEAAGFAKKTVDNVVLSVQVTRRVNGELSLGTATTVVTVNSANTLQADNAALQTSVNERQVRELPLVVGGETAGRSPLAFVFLDSSVTSTNAPGTSTANFHVNGNQGGSTDILIDGAATRRAQNGDFFTEVAPGPNAFQEYTVSTSQYSAEYGAGAGGVVNFTIKSGGNKFHGEAYDLIRNDKLDANQWLNDLNKLGKPRDHQNDFGANIGGPIRIPHLYNGTDHAFFFFNYEGYRFNNGEIVDITIPTTLMKTGNFSELLTDPYVISQLGGPVQIYDPHVQGAGRPAIPGNRLDTYVSPATGKSVLDPAGVKILSFFPTPTRAGVYHNYTARSNAPLTMNSYTGKVDLVLSERQRVSASYSYRNQPSVKGGFPRLAAPLTANGVWDQLFLTHYARLQHDFTFSPRLLNHVNLGWNRVFVTNRNTTVGTSNIASNIGIPANGTQNVAFPRIGFPGYGYTDPRAYQEVGSTFFSDRQGDNTVDIADALSWILGKHSFRVGGDFRIQQLNVTQFIDPGGSFNFRADQTGKGGSGGWPIASLITGATEFSFATIHTAQPAYRYHYPAFFVNDDYKVTQKLTLNLGVRYELPLPRTESHNFLRGFDQNAVNPVTGTKGALVSARGAGGLKGSSRSLSNAYYGNVAPRIGFAYSALPGTVLRGGWGIFYGPLQYNSDITAGTLGYSIARLITPGADYSQSTAFLSSYPAAPIADPTQQYVYKGCGPNGGNICQDVQYFNSPYRTGLTQQFSLNVQQDLTHSWAMQIGYVGHLGQRLFSSLQRTNAIPYNALRLGGPILNKPLSAVTAQDIAYASSVGTPIPAPPYAGFTGNVSQALRPFPQYNNIQNQNEALGRDYYHSLQARIDHRFDSGLQMGASYTWSREITNAAEDIIGNNSRLGGAVLQYPNQQNYKAVRTVSPDDVPHSFVVNYLYELPFGRGKHYLTHGGLIDTVVGGWSLNGIQRYQSGLPVLVSNSNPDFANNFLTVIGVGGNIRPNLTGAPLKVKNTGPRGTQYPVLNPAAFASPTSFNPNFTPDMTGSPTYAAYFSNPSEFFGNAPVVLSDVRPNRFLSEDMSLLKKTTLHENLLLETGVEGFNIFNRHRYNNPSSDLNASDFGQSSVVSGSNTARVFQLRARLVF